MFIETYLQDLREQKYSLAAWVRYASRTWLRGRKDVSANPGAARSILVLGLILFALTFAGCVLLGMGAVGTARHVLVWTGLWLAPLTASLVLHVGLLRTREGYSLSAINLATALTVARLASVPAFCLTLLDGHPRAAFWIFIAAMASDVLDGWAARSMRQETGLGAVLDPITDIIFALALFLSMRAAGLVSSLAAALAVLRYGGFLAGGVFLYVTHGPVRINSTLPGKISGLILGTIVGFLLLGPAYGAGRFGPVLTPLAHDAVVVLLAAGVLHGAVLGWHNWKHVEEAYEKVIRGVRFGG
ncbi:MAG TPA: CDP-alcohol phosphatidyltransferase family protein [Candidatus Eisenbacteria bacterium]|nr:CDP-alcohol phosphatidyltransferase family protein [Candidatus Eisenbacteria bacterium]